MLNLPAGDLSHEDRAHALRVFNKLLTTQEQKLDAIGEGAAVPLTGLITLEGQDPEVLRLCCEALESIAQVHQGRLAIVENHGGQALTQAMQIAPEAAAGALRRFSQSNDGVQLLAPGLDLIVPALVSLIEEHKQDGVSCRACENAAAMLSGAATTDDGILCCLKHNVPLCIVHLIDRGLTGDFRFEKDLMSCLEQCSACLEQVAHHPDGKTAVREADGIRALGQVLETARWHRPTVVRASAALMAVSIEKDSKVPIVLHAGKPLVRLLKGDDAELTSNARAALVSSCEHLEARRNLGPLLSEQEQKSILYRGPMPPTPPDFRYNVVLPYGPTDDLLTGR